MSELKIDNPAQRLLDILEAGKISRMLGIVVRPGLRFSA